MPYGVYDTISKAGLVTVGSDHDTAAFAVERIRGWWHTTGQPLNAGKTERLIASDGGGPNGVRDGLWKRELQQLANERGLAITVRHLRAATSKWNRIEHRRSCCILIKWYAKPLVSRETSSELLDHTMTREGWTVTAVVDQDRYSLGVQVTAAEMDQLDLRRDAFHPEWNYSLRPQTKIT